MRRKQANGPNGKANLGFVSSLVEGFKKFFETLAGSCTVRHCWAPQNPKKCFGKLKLQVLLYCTGMGIWSFDAVQGFVKSSKTVVN